MQTLSLRAQRRLKTFLAGAALWMVCLIAVIPIAATVLVSFKKQADIERIPPLLLPCDTPTSSFAWSACRWAVEGYARVFALRPDPNALLGFAVTGKMFLVYLPNTLLYAASAALLVVLLASLAGFAFSRYQFHGRHALLAAILAVTGVPLLTNLLGLYQTEIVLRKTLPFYDDRVFLVIAYLGFFLPISVWILKAFFDAIPRELEESAYLEGCTPLGALLRVVLPLSAPGLAAGFLMTFVGVWNEFITAYLLLSRNGDKTALFGLYDFLSQNIINLQVIAAACILIALPVVVLFLFARRSFFAAMLDGAVKG
jgi:ABC-type glycerol-3-phosphate transport system permease component